VAGPALNGTICITTSKPHLLSINSQSLQPQNLTGSIELCGRVVSISASYSGSQWFSSKPEERLSRGFLCPASVRFLPYPYTFTKNPLLFGATSSELLKSWLHKQKINKQ
jgi:hypothetical protein